MRAAILVALALAGCSLVNDPANHLRGGMDASVAPGGDASTDAALDAPGGIPFEDVCPRYAQAACEARRRCCPRDAGTPDAGSIEDCEREQQDLCARYYGAAVLDPRIDHDDVAAAAAIAEAMQLANRCDPAIASYFFRRDGLLRGLVGSVRGGGECRPSGSRPEDYFVALVSCAERSQVCHVFGSNPACLDPIGDGGACKLGPECASGRCVGAGALLLGSGVCGPGRADGEGCDWDWECRSYVCSDRIPRRCLPATAENVYCPGS